MTKPDRRVALLARMADHVLAQGLAATNVRPMAAAAGVSDRMLLYYFTDKDEILRAVFAEIAGRFGAMLAGADLSPVPPEALRRRLWTVMTAPDCAPYIQVYLELCVEAARGTEPHRAVAREIAQGFLAWVALQLDVPETARAAEAARLLAMMDGLWLMRAMGLDAAAAGAAG